jgi:CheY-like chemotaxis protein
VGTIPPQSLLRVLVVEAYEQTRESFRVLIGLWGHACQAAPPGSAALRAAAAFRPDVVLTDIGPPGTEEWEAACDMRRGPGLSGTVFVATTAYVRGVGVDRSYKEGFAAHFIKPFASDELKDFLETVAGDRAGLKADAVS